MAKLHILTLILRMWKLLFVHGYIRQPRYSFKVTGTDSKLQVQFQSYRYISKLRYSFKVTDIVSKLEVLLQMYRKYFKSTGTVSKLQLQIESYR